MQISQTDCVVTISSDLIDTFIASGGALSVVVDDFTTESETTLELADLTGSTYVISDLSNGVYKMTIKLDAQTDEGCIFLGCDLECTVVTAGKDSLNFILFDLLETLPQLCDACYCADAYTIYQRLIEQDCGC